MCQNKPENLKTIDQKYMKFSIRSEKMGYIGPVLRPADALRYAIDCIDSGHILLGVSGFHLLPGDKIQPDQELEIDQQEFDNYQSFLGNVGHLLMSSLNLDIVFEVAFEQDSANKTT